MCIICRGDYALAVDRHDHNIYIINADLIELDCFYCQQIRYQQLRIRRKYRNMVASIILDNTPFYDVLIKIMFNYTNTGFPRI